jgi:hypothetical protein
MLKKFVSNALLSVVMDKNAREKLAERKSEAPPKPAKSAKSPKSEPIAESDEEILSTISDALTEARAEGSGKAPNNGTRSKKQRFEPAPPARKPSPASPASPEREELIKQAMSVHRSKQQVFDDLPAEMRDKLMFMAMHAMDPSSLPPEARGIVEKELEAEKLAKGAPVDDIGSAAKPRRRKR